LEGLFAQDDSGLERTARARTRTAHLNACYGHCHCLGQWRAGEDGASMNAPCIGEVSALPSVSSPARASDVRSPSQFTHASSSHPLWRSARSLCASVSETSQGIRAAAATDVIYAFLPQGTPPSRTNDADEKGQRESAGARRRPMSWQASRRAGMGEGCRCLGVEGVPIPFVPPCRTLIAHVRPMLPIPSDLRLVAPLLLVCANCAECCCHECRRTVYAALRCRCPFPISSDLELT
jgi:hypothetical protein